ncbi:hypothetical protein C5137_07530 [Bacillus cereus]|uniref:hypothetical protein n=1 Tax=Bacillus cereus TaxID=1396 RepID=UPI001F5CBC06|nr:hypothetical protein [Bacillus cereus]MCI3146177.1 hypothetical protein [Bacillus cereus]
MKEEYTISCNFKCDETFYNDFEKYKQKLNNLNPVSKPLHNSEVLKYVLKKSMDNFDNDYIAEKKIEWIKEILNK